MVATREYKCVTCVRSFNSLKQQEQHMNGYKHRTLENKKTINIIKKQIPNGCSYKRPIFNMKLREKLLKQQRGVCSTHMKYFGFMFKPTPLQFKYCFTIDHIVENQQINYFDNREENLQAICNNCNQIKAKITKEILRLELELINGADKK